MVKTVKRTHHEEDDDEFSSRTPDDSSQKGKLDGKSSNRKANVRRSKHSETEQQRRRKINERFQTLKDLIPQDDQKRDQASFLLEVIYYIRFLQERLQKYEGPSQGLNAEPSKLMPWRRSSGPAAGSTHGDKIVIDPALLASARSSVEPDLTGAVLHKATDNPHMAANETIPFNMQLQPNLFEKVSVQPSRSSPDADDLTSQSQSLYWPGKQDAVECDVSSYGRNEQEDMKVDGEKAGISNAYCQRLLSTLYGTLASSGVDVSRANIKVQLDIGKSPSGTATATTSSSGENYDHARKRL